MPGYNFTDSHGPYVSMDVLHKMQYIHTKHYPSSHYSSIKRHHQLQLAYCHLAIDTVHVGQVLTAIRVSNKTILSEPIAVPRTLLQPCNEDNEFVGCCCHDPS